MKEKTNKTELLQLVSFKIGDELFGIDIHKVQEIIRMMPITKIPSTPEFVEGIVNLRDKVIPVVNLRGRMGFPKADNSSDTRIIVVELHGKITGFIVDEVREVLRISEQIMDEPPAMVAGIDKKFITSVGKLETGLILFLNLDYVFEPEETAELILD